MPFKRIFTLLFACLLANAAHSAVITTPTQTYWAVDGVALGLDVNRTDWESSFDVDLFDTSLGTLLEVRLTLWGEVGSIFEVTSNNNGARTATLNSEGEIVTDLLDVIVRPFGNFVTDPLTKGETYTSGMVVADDVFAITYSELADLAAWMGNGTRSIGVKAEGYSYVSGAGNVESIVNTWARAALTVSYTYESRQVPEPFPLALLGLSLLGLVAARQRKV